MYLLVLRIQVLDQRLGVARPPECDRAPGSRHPCVQVIGVRVAPWPKVGVGVVGTTQASDHHAQGTQRRRQRFDLDRSLVVGRGVLEASQRFRRAAGVEQGRGIGRVAVGEGREYRQRPFRVPRLEKKRSEGGEGDLGCAGLLDQFVEGGDCARGVSLLDERHCIAQCGLHLLCRRRARGDQGGQEERDESFA